MTSPIRPPIESWIGQDHESVCFLVELKLFITGLLRNVVLKPKGKKKIKKKTYSGGQKPPLKVHILRFK